MPSLLLVVFLVELAIQVVNSIGAAALSDALWKVYSALPIGPSAGSPEQRKLQREYLAVRTELHATSSKDEFAKWARLQRQHDKLLEQLEKQKKSLDSGRRSFDSIVTVLRLVLTRGPQYLMPFWFAKEPMFWLPHGWFPGYAEWLLAFPRAPRGSVSIASWQLACTGVLVLLRETLQALAALAVDWRQQQRARASASKTAASKTAGTKAKEAPVAAGESKKEL